MTVLAWIVVACFLFSLLPGPSVFKSGEIDPRSPRLYTGIVKEVLGLVLAIWILFS